MVESEAVRVAVRVRPLRASDRADGAQEILRKVAGEPQVRSRCAARRDGPAHACDPAPAERPDAHQVVLGGDRAFTFDQVLPATSTQREVYDACVQSLVRGRSAAGPGQGSPCRRAFCSRARVLPPSGVARAEGVQFNRAGLRPDRLWKNAHDGQRRRRGGW